MDEAVLRIVLDDSNGPAPTASPPDRLGPLSPPSSTGGRQSTPPKQQPPIDPSMFGQNYTATAKNLLRPIQYLDDRKKEREFLDRLLAHPELQSGGMQTELRRLGEDRLAMYSSLRKAMGRPDTTPPLRPATPATVPVTDTTGLKGMGAGIAKGMMDNLYEGMFEALKQGKDKFAGVRDPILAKAKPFFEQGLLKSVQDFKDLVKSGFDPSLARLTPVSPAAPPQGRLPDEPRPAAIDGPSEYSARTQKRLGLDMQPPPAIGRLPDEPRPASIDDPSDLSLRTRERLARERSQPPPIPAPSDQGAGGNSYSQAHLEGKAILERQSLERDRKMRADASRAPPPSVPMLSPAPPAEIEPAFDPTEEARKRRAGERRSAQVDAAYKEQYGDRDKKKPMDAVLNVVDSLRGTIGGLFGRLAGAAVDVVQGIRKARADSEKEDYTKQLLDEDPTTQPPTAKPVQLPQALPVQKPPLAAQVPVLASAKDQSLVPKAQPIAPPKVASIASVTEAVAPALASLGSSAGMAAMALGPVGIAAAAVVVAFGAITAALDTAVKRYGEVSPQVAQAQAMVEVRQTMNDIRRGQQHGAELARYAEAQGRMQEKYEEAKMKFLIKMAPTVESILEILGGIMELLGAVSPVIETVFAPLTFLGNVASSISEIVGMQRDDRFKDADDPTSVLFKEGKDGVQVPDL